MSPLPFILERERCPPGSQSTKNVELISFARALHPHGPPPHSLAPGGSMCAAELWGVGSEGRLSGQHRCSLGPVAQLVPLRPAWLRPARERPPGPRTPARASGPSEASLRSQKTFLGPPSDSDQGRGVVLGAGFFCFGARVEGAALLRALQAQLSGSRFCLKVSTCECQEWSRRVRSSVPQRPGRGDGEPGALPAVPAGARGLCPGQRARPGPVPWISSRGTGQAERWGCSSTAEAVGQINQVLLPPPAPHAW